MNKTLTDTESKERTVAIDQLQSIILTHGLNRAEVAEAIGISREHMSRIINGRDTLGPTAYRLIKRWLEDTSSQYPI